MLHLCKSRFLFLKSKKLFAPTFEAESKKRPQPTKDVTAFPLGEGVGTADGRGHCLPPRGRCRRSLRKQLSPSGRVARSAERGASLASKQVYKSSNKSITVFPLGREILSPDSNWGKVSAQPMEEVTAFPLGEGVATADGRGHRLKIRTDYTNQTNFIR